MDINEEKVLSVLNRPLTNIEISKRTRLNSIEVSKTIRKLSQKGKVVSIGYTSSRKHMRLAAAITMVLDRLRDVDCRVRVLEKQK